MKEIKSVNTSFWLTLIFASTFLFSFGIVVQNVFAMGPSSCYNQYNDPFTSFIINNGTQAFDALANPGVTFNVGASSSYTVTFVMHTPSTSSWGNSNPGDTWFDQDLNGFVQGACVEVNPNQNVTLSYNIGNPHEGQGYVQSVFWGTAASSGTSYNVQWITTSAPQPPTGLTATAVSSSQINLSWTAPNNNGGSAITGYKIQRSTDDSTWHTIITNTGSTGTTYSNTGLSPNTTYYYKVFALNAVGHSTSAKAHATTPLASRMIPSAQTLP